MHWSLSVAARSRLGQCPLSVLTTVEWSLLISTRELCLSQSRFCSVSNVICVYLVSFYIIIFVISSNSLSPRLFFSQLFVKKLIVSQALRLSVLFCLILVCFRASFSRFSSFFLSLTIVFKSHYYTPPPQKKKKKKKN